MKINNKNLVFSIIFLMILCLPLGGFTTIIGRAPENTLDGRLHISESMLWPINGTVINNALNDQQGSQIVSDGAGGAIITWYDNRPGSISYDIYAQKIDATGMIQWNSNGVVICNATSSQLSPQITSDGSGGAIIIWEDSRTSAITGADIYAQRINSDGNILWTANGTLICNATNRQHSYKLIGDGFGGAIIAWQDGRLSSEWDIYAQKINSTGTVQWTANGTVICNATHYQTALEIISDGAGGAIITWDDGRNFGITGYDIYAQKIDSSGTVKWTTNGTVICNATADQKSASIISAGAGGAIITWDDNRYSGSTEADIYAQKIDSSGVGQWTSNGTVICNAADQQKFPSIVSNGAGGAIITWTDKRTASNYDIYTQEINSAGMVQWTANGTTICNALGDQLTFQTISDNSGGAIITWDDNRPGSISYDIYAQKIDSTGILQWTPNGIVICNALGEQSGSRLVSDGTGGAIITWDDNRNSGTTSWDVYAQKIDDHPSGGGQIPGFDLVVIFVISAISVISAILMHYRKKKLMRG